ncbi:MAG: DegT/DnrJ/EryC1/StrS family aminotransferase [Deltaproteobacteria bacterium]|nr:DegT/DnrJ/EryC1/StrS family aminotransferase [Deltaproteobacteria bacterium]
MKTIPHSKPTIDRSDIEAVSAVLESGLIAQGAVVERFEDEFASYNGVKGGVAVSSGTAALHLAFCSLGTGPGHEVIIPSYSCIALHNAVSYTGAETVLADTAKGDWNMDPEWVEDYLRKDKKRRVRAIAVVHLFGSPASLDDFIQISEKYSVPLVEDCAQAVGAEYKGGKTGSFGRVSVFSFYATKVMTTGEGGMVISDSKKVLDSVRDLREYDEKRDGRLRFNYKMTDLQAAMGLSQLRRLPEFIKKRRAVAKAYDSGLNNRQAAPTADRCPAGDIFYRYVLRMRHPAAFIREMESKGIACRRPVFMPMHRTIKRPTLPNAEKIWKEAVSLPIYPSLQGPDIKRIIAAANKAMEGGRR